MWKWNGLQNESGSVQLKELIFIKKGIGLLKNKIGCNFNVGDIKEINLNILFLEMVLKKKKTGHQ